MPLYLKDKMISGVSLGVPGKSAYQTAIEAGYVGTETAFNEALSDIPGHIDNTDNPHRVTAAQVNAYTKGESDTLLANKAPAGFGLGAASKELTSDNDIDTIFQNGWYRWGSSVPKNAPATSSGNNEAYAFMRVSNYGSGNCIQEFWNLNDDAKYKLQRICRTSVWQPIEWVNPPLITDIPYRTSDRINNKVVYKKRTSSGEIQYSIDGGTTWNSYVAEYGAGVIVSKSVTSTPVTKTASELQAYINSLPRLLTENITITVTGTLTTSLNISNFYGSGSISIQGTSLGSFIMKDRLGITNCNVSLWFTNIQIEAPSGIGDNRGLITVSECKYLRFYNCKFTSDYKEKGVRVISSGEGSAIGVESCTITGFDVVVFSGRNSNIAMVGNSSFYSNNNVGAYVWNGGIVFISGDDTGMLGAASHIKSGGIIVKYNGTLL